MSKHHKHTESELDTDTMQRHLFVIETRTLALQLALRDGNHKAVETHCDRVLLAVRKAQKALT